MRLTKIFLGILIIAAVMQIGAECHCDNSIIGRAIKRMSGNITAVDTFESTVAVQWQDQDLIHYNITTFKIPEGMTFSKETDTVDILDVNVGEPVTIEYYVDESGTPRIVRMDIGQ